MALCVTVRTPSICRLRICRGELAAIQPGQLALRAFMGCLLLCSTRHRPLSEKIYCESPSFYAFCFFRHRDGARTARICKVFPDCYRFAIANRNTCSLTLNFTFPRLPSRISHDILRPRASTNHRWNENHLNAWTPSLTLRPDTAVCCLLRRLIFVAMLTHTVR